MTKDKLLSLAEARLAEAARLVSEANKLLWEAGAIDPTKPAD